MASEAWFVWQDGDLLLHLKVQPRASRDAFGEVLAGSDSNAIKIAIVAPPIDGKANRYLLKFLAKSCGVPQRQIQLVRGEASRHKTVLVQRPTKLPAALTALGV